MNIVILGGGTVGHLIGDLLCQQEHSITLVDSDKEMVRKANEELDLRALHGSASQSSVLFQAGISSADICLAVTGNDETNIVAASMAKAMGARRSIARVYAPVFRDLSTFDYQSHFGIDRILSLEHLTAMELARCIRTPGSVVVEQFARGDLEVQELVVGQECKVTCNQIRDLGLPANVKIGTINRNNRMWIASAEDQLEIGDKVTIFCRPEDTDAVYTMFKTDRGKPRRVVIAGGGETGLHLAQILCRERFKIMIIEQNEARCHELAKQVDSATIIHAKATDSETLEEHRVGNADVFVATTGDDEENMMLGVRANDLGTEQVFTTIGRPDYGSIVQRLGIDRAVSARDVMAKQVLAYLNEGNIISKTKMPGGLINVVEVDVSPDSRATTSTIAELGLPERCLIVAMVKQDVVRVPGAKDKFSAHDTAILLLEDDVLNSAVAAFKTMA
ncbi:MAG: Trk system potassium transporter TrkA [Planctomycetota bacterium]